MPFTASDHPRDSGGRFAAKAHDEAPVALTPAAPEPFVHLTTPEYSMLQAEKAAAERGWTTSAPTWPREDYGYETKRTDYTPTEADAAAVRALLEAEDDSTVAVYWEEKQWSEENGVYHSEELMIEAGEDFFVYQDQDGPAEALGTLFAELDDDQEDRA